MSLLKRGFTLIELLVVIAIIGLLASIVMTSLNTARAKARDSSRVSTLSEIRKALELYYHANGKYPARNAASSAIQQGHPQSLTEWQGLGQDLAPYISKLADDPRNGQSYNSQFKFAYFYDADSGDNYQSYGLAVLLESNYSLAENDGGVASGAYEIGIQPSYCTKYPITNTQWWNTAQTVCQNGN